MSVIVNRNPNCFNIHKKSDFSYQGSIIHTDYEYINRGAKTHGKHICKYINFYDKNAYHNLLLQGSPIYCFLNKSTLFKCYIESINKTNNIINSMKVAILTDDYVPYPKIYNITVDDVDSMLITDEAYVIIKN